MARLWTCCKRPPRAPGCQRNMCHVHQQNVYDNLEGYVRLPKATEADKNCGVFAIGCEMVNFSMHATNKSYNANITTIIIILTVIIVMVFNHFYNII